MKAGQSIADDRVERSLYQRACGYDLDVRKTVTRREGKDVITTVTETTVHVPGDVTAQTRWLTNRRPRQWRERLDVSEPPPQRSLEEIKAGIVKKLIDWGIKIVPPDDMVIEGEPAPVTNGVARIGVKTRGPNG
jgi:hypothetical protein